MIGVQQPMDVNIVDKQARCEIIKRLNLRNQKNTHVLIFSKLSPSCCSEVITIQTGDPVNYLFRPDCTCPRDYLKVTLPIPELFYDYSMCYDDLLPTASLPRFSGSRFLTDIDVEYPAPPWISDFTNNMKLTISFPQQMQVCH